MYLIARYTTATNMEFPENAMEALVYDILICWNWLGNYHKQALLMKRTNEACIQDFVTGITQNLRPVAGKQFDC